MEVISAYSLASVGWLGVQALPLLVWPSFVASLLSTELLVAPVPVTTYFARALGLAQLGLALQLLVLSGVLPLHAGASGGGGSDASSASASAAARAPYAWAVVLVSTLYHGAAAFYSYGCYYSKLQATATAFALGCAGSSALAGFGLWCLLFGDGSGHVSRRTGADKRTSGFPFRNAAAYERKAR